MEKKNVEKYILNNELIKDTTKKIVYFWLSQGQQIAFYISATVFCANF